MAQLKQKVGETVPVCLLWLWDDGVDNMQLSSQKCPKEQYSKHPFYEMGSAGCPEDDPRSR